MSAIEYNNPCTTYSDDCDGDEWIPCKCPICGGFLPSDIWQDSFICKKCGSELIAVEHSEKFQESDNYDGFSTGKICVVTPRKKTITQCKEERAINRLVKSGIKTWKGWL
jgi:hypothetical protein